MVQVGHKQVVGMGTIVPVSNGKGIFLIKYQFSSVQLLIRVQLFATPWITARQASLSITNSRSSLKLMSIESVMPSSHLILGHPLLLLPQSLPASGSFPMSQLFTWGAQRIGDLASTSVLTMNTQGWSPLGWTAWISLQSKGLSRVFSNTTVLKHQFFGTQFSSQSNSHPYMTTGKTIALTRQTFVGKVMYVLFNILSWLVITFLPRSKSLLISWLQSPSAVILEPKKGKSDTVSAVSPSISHEVMGPNVFWMLSFKPTFSLSSFTFIKRLFSSSSLYAIRVVSSAYLKLLIFLPANLIPACASSSPAFLMMYSAYKLNKHDDNIQPCTPFPVWNQSVVPCPVLTVASWPAYRFLKRQVRWSGIPISLRILHSLVWSTQSKDLV